jgi:hypothetical protein
MVGRDVEGIMRILDQTKEDAKSQLDREDRIQLAMEAVSLGVQVEKVVSLLNWKDFEGLVANILEENSFTCVESFRRRGNQELEGMEIDVIGVKGSTIVSVDAKMWGVRGGKSSALKTAAENQNGRTYVLSTELERLSKKMKTLQCGSYHLLPMIVTWLVEDVQFYDGVPIIPVFKFNSFMLQLPDYEEMIVSYKGELKN